MRIRHRQRQRRELELDGKVRMLDCEFAQQRRDVRAAKADGRVHGEGAA
jgi:hypothetical protein